MPKRCEICSNLAIKTPEQYHCGCSGIFNVNLGYISHIFLVLLLLSLNK